MLKQASKNNIIQLTLLTLLALIIVLVSYPGWKGDFIFDDYANIVLNPVLRMVDSTFNSLWSASLSFSNGKRPFSMMTFALNVLAGGFNPFAFKVVNTLIHIVNAFVVFLFTVKLLSVQKFNVNLKRNALLVFAFAIALIWSISPININSSLYIVQRMNELSSLFILLGCYLYIRVRTHSILSSGMQVLWYIIFILCLALAVLSKQNGVLLIPLSVIIELFCLNQSEKNNPLFFKLYIVTIVLAFIAGTLGLIWYFPHFISGYGSRDFTLIERVLSQFRILISYNQQFLFPDIYQLSYLHDDFQKSLSLFQPLTTLWSLLFIIGLFVVSLVKRSHTPWLIFSLLWFFIAHSIESTFISLELYFEHRNYLASYGVILGLMLFIYQFIIVYTSSTNRERSQGITTEADSNLSKNNYIVFILLLGAYSLYLIINAHLYAKISSNSYVLIETLVENHPDSLRTQISWGDANKVLYALTAKEKHYAKAKAAYLKALQLAPERVIAHTNLIVLSKLHGDNVSEQFEKLFTILATFEIRSVINAEITSFMNNIKNYNLKFNRSTIDKFYSLLLSNKNIRGKTRGKIYQQYATYLEHQEGLSQRTLDNYRLSLKYAPNVLAKIMVAEIMLEAGNIAEANTLLVEAKALNKKNMFKTKINFIENRIKSKRNIQQ